MARQVHAIGDEQDAFTPWRRVYHWRPGEIKQIKRRANKRDRRQAKGEIRAQRGDR